MKDELQNLITELEEIADELEMYGQREQNAFIVNIGQAVRSLVMAVRIKGGQDE